MNKILLFTIVLLNFINVTHASNRLSALKVDNIQVNNWNAFVTELYQLHTHLINNVPIMTRSSTGGYGGLFANKNFYREISYFNTDSNKIISKIQWQIDKPETIHAIEVYLYNKQGQVKTDYYARFLPTARNAPVQTLINLHNYNDDLHSFRQFDASGELIYETCRGKFFNEIINLHLDDEEIYDFRSENDDELLNEAYSACFFNVSRSAEHYLHPVIFIKDTIKKQKPDIDEQVASLNHKLKLHPNNPLNYIKRGDLFFKLNAFEKSINDYNSALLLDDSLYQANFGRGMALARNGQVNEGIKDLSLFIKHNPDSSIAYTKRGVRNIWIGKLDQAKIDLLMAIKLDNKNSEAHDDLGVVFAKQKSYKNSLVHFKMAIKNDPTYQKAYHNIAMVYMLTNKPEHALIAINKSLKLDSESRNSLSLKSEILMAVGKEKEAATLKRKAEFLPESNWSEELNIQ